MYTPRVIKRGNIDNTTYQQIRGNIDDIFMLLNKLTQDGNVEAAALGDTEGTATQGEQGDRGATGVQGVTGLANFYEDTAFGDPVLNPALLWNTTNNALYAFMDSIQHWVQISAGTNSGPTGLAGAAGATGTQGITGLIEEAWSRVLGDTGESGLTGMNYVELTNTGDYVLVREGNPSRIRLTDSTHSAEIRCGVEPGIYIPTGEKFRININSTDVGIFGATGAIAYSNKLNQLELKSTTTTRPAVVLTNDYDNSQVIVSDEPYQGFRVSHSLGTSGMVCIQASVTGISFNGVGVQAKPTVGGYRDINAATNLITSLNTIGLITNGTTGSVVIDYAATSTIAGCTGTMSPKTLRYYRVGNLIYCMYDLKGYSSGTSLTFTLPKANRGGGNAYHTLRSIDGGNYDIGFGVMSSDSATVALYNNMNGSGWTDDSADKAASGSFSYYTTDPA